MKIITWNCQGAFRKKAEFILAYQPDILVVPECEHPDKLKFKSGIKTPADQVWFGSNPHKGLGVFSYSDYRFKLLDGHNTAIRNVLPIAVCGGPVDFILFAVWAYNPADPDGTYTTQVWKAIHHYDELLQDNPVILTGDFNSNVIWDKPKRKDNHSAVVDRLARKGILSTYHHFERQIQGKEEQPTFFLQRNKSKPYHLDYCFASSDLMEKLASVEIGSFETWTEHSDHSPVISIFNL